MQVRGVLLLSQSLQNEFVLCFFRTPEVGQVVGRVERTEDLQPSLTALRSPRRREKTKKDVWNVSEPSWYVGLQELKPSGKDLDMPPGTTPQDDQDGSKLVLRVVFVSFVCVVRVLGQFWQI